MSLPNARQFAETVNRAQSVLVVTREEWSKDGLAAGLALTRALVAQGKKAEFACAGFTPPPPLRFLPGVNDIRPRLERLRQFVIVLDVAKTGIDQLSYDLAGDKMRIQITPKNGQYAGADVSTEESAYRHDLVIAVDAPDLSSLGALFRDHPDFFYHVPTANIDHEATNEHYGNLNVVDLAACSSCEVIYRLLKESGRPFLDEDSATLLLSGLIAKTKSFRSPSVTPRALDIAAELLKAGARREEIIKHLYRTRPIETLKLWGRALARLKYDPETKMAWSLLARQDFIHAGATDSFLADVVDELITTAPDAEIVALLYEQEDAAKTGGIGGVCALVSSEKHADVLRLVETLRPGGHRRMARICFPEPSLALAEKAVLGAIAKSLGKGGARAETAKVVLTTEIKASALGA